MTKPQHKPWYIRARRWGQTNLTEIDPEHYDPDFWRAHWRRTHTQGVIVNAGGIVAYYPSRIANHYTAAHLKDRDLFGEILQAARADGLAVLARMDSNRVTADFYRSHPDWFAVDSEGLPSITQGRYQACVNSPYYKDYIPDVLREIVVRYKPDGFTDNSWTGLGRNFICHCAYCSEKFENQYDRNLPRVPDWSDETYRIWMRWSYQCRLENWTLNNAVTREAGGEDCLWAGMVNADPVGGYSSFCDLAKVAFGAKIILSDHQSRSALHGFEQNSLNGKLLHSLAGWDVLIPESMAHYVRGRRVFRRASNPPKETNLWMAAGIAGGISPWWHHIGARQEDHRQFETSIELLDWHQKNERYLYDRKPVANVGLVWSLDNTVFYGQEEAYGRTALPWRGFTRALTRARIPFVPVNANQIGAGGEGLDVLILPALAAVSEPQFQSLQKFVEQGGSLVLTGNTAILDEWGQPRESYPLKDLVGINILQDDIVPTYDETRSWEVYEQHSYLRLPEPGDPNLKRHPILDGFDATDILPFGGWLLQVEPEHWMQVVATLIPAFPIYPPEFSYMRQTHTNIPALLAGEKPNGSRIVYFAGDIDRCYGQAHLPDHGDLLANAVLWAGRKTAPLKITGPGYLDCSLYAQENRLILHIVNLTGTDQNPGYVEEIIPVGPLQIEVFSPDFTPNRVDLRVAGGTKQPRVKNGWASVSLDTLHMHEMLVWG